MASVLKLSSRPTHEYWEIPVLFEDESLLALDKPPGFPASPDRVDPARPNLMALLHAGIRAEAPWAKARGLTYLANAHRLDVETSGILLVAKSKAVLISLANLFGSERPAWTYVALVQGSPRGRDFEIAARLAPHPHRLGVMRVDPRRGKKSLTAFRVLEAFRGYTVMGCYPRAVRTHQIRAHLQHARLPIVGDSLYGGRPLWLSRLKRQYRLKPGREERPLIRRVALHAAALEVPHPLTGAPVQIESPWPKDLRVAVKYLRLYGLDTSAGPEGEAACGGAEPAPDAEAGA